MKSFKQMIFLLVWSTSLLAAEDPQFYVNSLKEALELHNKKKFSLKNPAAEVAKNSVDLIVKSCLSKIDLEQPIDTQIQALKSAIDIALQDMQVTDKGMAFRRFPVSEEHFFFRVVLLASYYDVCASSSSNSIRSNRYFHLEDRAKLCNGVKHLNKAIFGPPEASQEKYAINKESWHNCFKSLKERLLDDNHAEKRSRFELEELDNDVQFNATLDALAEDSGSEESNSNDLNSPSAPRILNPQEFAFELTIGSSEITGAQDHLGGSILSAYTVLFQENQRLNQEVEYWKGRYNNN